ncbi:hypothetical protein ZWY2020_007852 [Hordeum vulgare]|nr:hypothetical protein ZWY2020_007852 [Hordeum vulgare]
MPLSAASILRASSLALLLLAATATGGDCSTTSESSVAQSIEDTEMYLCYLCTGRNPMLIRYCPIYWDWCHLVCYAPTSLPGPLRPCGRQRKPRPPRDIRPAGVRHEAVPERHLRHRQPPRLLQNGQLHPPAAAATSPTGKPGRGAAAGYSDGAPGMLPSSRVAEFQRCGDQAMGLLSERRPRPRVAASGAGQLWEDERVSACKHACALARQLTRDMIGV